MLAKVTEEKLTWEKRIQDAALQGSRNDEGSRQDLCDRLTVIERLMIHHPVVFQETIQAIEKELQHGISCKFILNMLNKQQPLYQHAEPMEKCLLQALHQSLAPLFAWFDAHHIENKDRINWISWFETIKPTEHATLFFNALQQENVKPFSNDLMEVFSSLHAEDRNFYGSKEALVSLVHCIKSYQLLSSSMQEPTLDSLIDAVYTEVSPKQLARTMDILVQCAIENVSWAQLMILDHWWLFAHSDNVSNENLAMVLAIIKQLGNLAHNAANEFFIKSVALTIRTGMQMNITTEQWVSYSCFVQNLQNLPAAWQQNCCYYINQHPEELFDASWQTKLKNVMQHGNAITKEALTDEDMAKVIHILMHCSDMQSVCANLTHLNQVKQSSLQFSEWIHMLSVQSNPSLSLQKIEEWLQIRETFNNPQQQWFDSALKKIFSFCCDDGKKYFSRTHQFIQLFKAFSEWGIVDDATFNMAYDLWFKEPFCSTFELKEKLECILKAKNRIPDNEVLQDIIQAPSEMRHLMLDVVLPNIQNADEVVRLWKKIKVDKNLQDRSYLYEVLLTQKKIKDLTNAEFTALLSFDNVQKTNERRRILHGLYHYDADSSEINKHKVWWQRYFDALANWLHSKFVSSHTKLDNLHHMQAIQALKNVVYVVEELHEIVAPNNSQAITISDALRNQLTAYQTAYNASPWWRFRSQDRIALSKQLFQWITLDDASYSQVIASIETVLNAIVETDCKHLYRNAKGYSRLYDIAIQLLTITLSEALQNDALHSTDYLSMVKTLMVKHKQLVNNVNLEITAFKHLQDMADTLEQPIFKLS